MRSSSAILAFGIILVSLISQCYGNLKVGYYIGKCGKHNVEAITFAIVKDMYLKDRNVAPHLIRLHFHDCIVRGCEGSVLLEGPKTEKTAKPNLSLGGFEVIDTAKDVFEQLCPGVVSCSDLLAIATRSAVALTGGKWYYAETGRRDGRVSSQKEALANLPSVNMPVRSAVNLFNSRGLTKEDFVVLLGGGHSVGNVHCDKFQDRLYNFYGSGKPDGRINPSLLSSLRNTCPKKGPINRTTYLDQTPNSAYKMDNGYYKQIVSNRAILEIDTNVANSPLTNSIVKKLAYNEGEFIDKFGPAMIKLGRVGVLTGKQGEIRRSCRAVNH